MSLVIPTSNADPGRAARPVLAEAPTTGAELAKLGQITHEVGARLEGERLDRQMKRLTVDMTKDVNDLRLEVEQIGDPDQAEMAWQAGTRRIRESYNQVGEDGRPRLDPKNAESFDLAFDDLTNRHAYSLGSRMVGLRRAEREATFVRFSHEVKRGYAGADADMRQLQRDQGYEMIDAMVAEGHLDAAEAERWKISWGDDLENTRAIGQITQDPQAFLEAVEAGEYTSMDGEQLERHKASARSAVASAEEKAARQSATALKAEQAEMGKTFDGILTSWGTGRPTVHDGILETDAAKAHPRYAEMVAARALRDRKLRYGEMSVMEIRAVLTGKDARPVAGDLDLEERKFLEGLLEQHERGYRTDPIGYAQETGAVALPDLPTDGDPQQLAGALTLRVDAASELAARGDMTRFTVFSEDERKHYAEIAQDSSNPDAQLALAYALAGGLGPAARQQAQQLSTDPTFDWTVALASAGVPTSTTEAILAGQAKIDGKVALVPTRKDALTEFHDITDGQFSGMDDLSSGVVASALALYAQDHPGEDPAEFDTRAFAEKVNLALGGDGAAGGMHEFRGQALALPPGVAGDALDDAIDQVAADLGATSWYGGKGRKSGNADGPSLDRLTAASLTGAAPWLGDPDADGYDPAAVFGDLELVPLWLDGVPTDRYFMVNSSGTRLKDADGALFQLSLSALIRGAQ